MDPSASYETPRLREEFGVQVPVNQETLRKLGKAVLAVAAGDGALSPRELDSFLGTMRTNGASPETLDALRAFEPRRARPEEFLDATTRPLARVILYHALRVARADGLDQRERDTAVRAAKVLGIDPNAVLGIEAILQVEDAVRSARIKLLSSVE